MNNLFKNKLVHRLALVVLLVLSVPAFVFAAEEGEPALFATAWSLLPPLIAIALALITKEVYSSLFLGVVAGGLLIAQGNFAGTIEQVLVNGVIGSLSDSWNVGILVFLVVLGMFVAMITLSGGSAAFGRWASTKVKTRAGAQFATVALGALIFIDDYFNCLTVGSVMQPLTDKHNISRAKLAYLVDATAAPICIIAPISSWAAAVTGFVEGTNGLTLFIQTIPYNFYALLTIVMMITIIKMDFDYGPMKRHEDNAKYNNDLFSADEKNIKPVEEIIPDNPNGKVSNMVLPIVLLIVACVLGMIHTGGFFSGESFVDAFANSDASVGLVYGSVCAFILTIAYYLVRKILPFSKCMECIPTGFKQMIAPILILTLAWSLKAMTDGLGLADYVSNLLGDTSDTLMSFFPAMIFLVGCGLAFASGTSWGTFGILIPIALAVTQNNPDLMIIGMSACMAGAVFGDHCSPISDTTIMASAGAGSNHIAHVITQAPYALTVAAVSVVTYIVAGFVRSAWISLPIGIVLMIVTLKVMKSMQKNKVAA